MNRLLSFFIRNFRETLRKVYYASKRFSKTHGFIQNIYLKNVINDMLIFPSSENNNQNSIIHSFKEAILIDAQCLQSESFNRGIGRYSRMLIISLAKLQPKKTFVLFFNSFVKVNSIQKIKQSFPDNLENIKFYTSRAEIKPDGMSIEKLAKAMSNEIAEMNPSLFLALSIMEAPNNVIPVNPRAIENSMCILYDVIPLQFPEIFLLSPSAKKLYDLNIRRLLSYPKIVSISEKSIENLRKYFSEFANVYPIYGAGFEDSSFNLEGLAFSERRGFMAVGSTSLHKNLRNVIEAYANLPSKIRNNHQLSLVGVSEESEKKNLRQLAKKHKCKVLIHDFLEEEQLSYLYRTTRIAIAAAWEEGLCMPIFESWSHGGICIGSQGSAISEILGNAEACFDPLDPKSISAIMIKYLDNEDVWNREKNRVAIRAKSMSWNSTAKRFADFAKLN
jgi:glycosyltransferase involved in cell wall biosynthesis